MLCYENNIHIDYSGKQHMTACLLNLIHYTLPAPSHASTIVMFSNLNHDSRTGSPDAVRCPSQYSFPGQLLPSLCTQNPQHTSHTGVSSLRSDVG